MFISMGTMTLILKLLVLGLFLINNYGVEGVRSISKLNEEDFELEAQLKLLNKPPIKTFHTEWGDTVDCIDIYKQPAFDNPLLKNHKIQLSSSDEETDSTREYLGKNKPNVNLSEAMSKDLQCPEGTVPIRRTSKADLLRIRSLSVSPNDASGQHRATINLVKSQESFYGANANINLYNPKVNAGQFSMARVFVSKGEQLSPNKEAVVAGWVVSPGVNGDTRTRLFGYWTADGFNKTGCWNTVCAGFVQVHKSLYINVPFKDISVYGGQQYALDLLITQGRTGHWWVRLGGQDIGYWPQELFKGLTYGADFLSWGGQVLSGTDGISPPMGSGHIPDVCYMRHVQYRDAINRLVDLKDNMPIQIYNDCKLYSVTKIGYMFPQFGFEFFFGGPGGKCSP